METRLSNISETVNYGGIEITRKSLQSVVVPVADFVKRIKAQGVPVEHVAFVCPRCKTVQSAYDLVAVGAGRDIDEVEKYMGFACIGRWMGAEGARPEPDGLPCDWSLGGLIHLHEIEIEYHNGRRACFDLATPEQAKAHMKENLRKNPNTNSNAKDKENEDHDQRS